MLRPAIEPALDRTASPAGEQPRARDLYIDRLRTVLTAIVVVFHCAITYGASGGWFYHEIQPSRSPSSLLMTVFVTTNQAYFMGFFFLLAGYFTPASLERKGYGRFIVDRFLRLGVPLLAFVLILGPLTAAMVTAAQGDGFWPTFAWLWRRKVFINGPMWFVQALLIFSVMYCAWRAAAGASLGKAQRTPKAIPAQGWWLLSALATGVVALAIRQIVPVGENVFGLQLGYFASYVFLFAVGIAAWRHNWLSQLRWKNARPWIFGLVVTWPCMPAAVAIVVARRIRNPNFSGGLSWPAIVYALWEPFVAWGIIAAWLLLFRRFMNRESRLWSWLNRRAYTVYIIHPVILVGITLALRGWAAPAMVKWAGAGTLAVIVCWLAADPLVRLPGVRRIV